MTPAFHNPRPAACKVCGAAVRRVGSVDFNRVGVEPAPLPPAGVAVDYWQCGGCGFAWAPGFDDWDDARFRQAIYNPELERIETLENARERAGNVLPLVQRFVDHAGARRLLDYGCGPGVLVERMQRAGWDASGYDRYYPGRDARPAGMFDVVTCFEVLEHVHRIDETLDDLLAFLAPDGIVVIGTFLCAQPLDLQWWYCSPRSGHIAFWTVPALNTVFHRRKLNVASDGRTFHFVFGDAAKPKIRAVFGVG